jgi:hypothetical protein
MHMSEVYRTIWKGVDAINDALPVDLEWVQDPRNWRCSNASSAPGLV